MERSISAVAFFELAFGRPPHDSERDRLAAMLPHASVRSPADAHRLLAAFDAQTHPTTLSARATTANLRLLDLGDFALWIDDDDPSVSAIIAHESGWESHVSDALSGALRPGAAFVDVGANVGFHTFRAAAVVGPAGSVTAFEASPENCRLLQLSKLENRADNVEIVPTALDRSPGLRYLSAHIGTNAGLVSDTRADLLAGNGTVVPATTLDAAELPAVDVMKIDVEGAEFRVLAGARKTLDRHRPVIVMELSCEMAQRVGGVDPAVALQEILDAGYRLYLLDRTSREAVPYASARALLDGWGDPFRIEDLLLQPA